MDFQCGEDRPIRALKSPRTISISLCGMEAVTDCRRLYNSMDGDIASDVDEVGLVGAYTAM